MYSLSYCTVSKYFVTIFLFLFCFYFVLFRFFFFFYVYYDCKLVIKNLLKKKPKKPSPFLFVIAAKANSIQSEIVDSEISDANCTCFSTKRGEPPHARQPVHERRGQLF